MHLYWSQVTFENVAENLRESFRQVAASRQAGEIRELPGVSIASAGATFQMFNSAFLSSEVANDAELERRILLASAHFGTRGLEWAYWVCEDWMSPQTRRRSRVLFERNGLRHSVNLPGMVADRVAMPVKPLPRLEVKRVGDEATQEAFCTIGSICFRVPHAWFREVFDGQSVWQGFAGYVGYLAGVPVSTTAAVQGGGAIGIYNVATLPEYQHRGYGEAVMRYALDDARAKHGIERSILQSTPAGYRLYERMGYRTITQVSVYAS
jgi:ribosomal protein S18 acetylase RimI-like enzyme